MVNAVSTKGCLAVPPCCVSGECLFFSKGNECTSAANVAPLGTLLTLIELFLSSTLVGRTHGAYALGVLLSLIERTNIAS